MQVAYALDNMHLAKILLLKLNGIQVTDDNDPRIAQVKDEDFASSFMPNGGIVLDEETERRCQEADRRERERKRLRQREERLRVCERIWEASARCLREEKARVAKKKEDDSRERRRLHIAARGRHRDTRIKHESDTIHNDPVLSTTSRPFPASSFRLHHNRPVLSYGSLPAAPSRVSHSPPDPAPPLSARRPDPPTFQYQVMSPPPRILSSTPSPPLVHPKKSSPLSSPHRTLMELSSQSVPFAAVVMSMYGPLFPPVAAEEDQSSTRSLCGKTKRRKSVRQMQLLEDLLAPECWQEVPESSNTSDRSSSRNSSCSMMINDKTRSVLTQSPTSSLVSSSSSSNTVTTRSAAYSSWFSFSSRSTRTATTTTATTRSSRTGLTLPSHSHCKVIARNDVSSSSRYKLGLRRERVWVEMDQDPLRPISLRSSIAFSSPSSSSVSYRTSKCRPSLRKRTSRIAFPSSTKAKSSLSTVVVGEGLVQKMSRSVLGIVAMAGQFQRAYVKATMFGAGTDLYSSHGYYSSSSSSRGGTSRTRGEKNGRWGERELGYRVEREDVRVFISGSVLEGVAFPLGSPPSSTSTSSTSSSVASSSSPSAAATTAATTTPSSLSLPELPPSRNPNRVVDEDDIVASGHRRLRPLIPLVPVSSFSSSLFSSSPSSSSSSSPYATTPTTTPPPYPSKPRPNRPRIIPLPLPIPRSPFRPTDVPGHLMVRLRPVSNPLMLRLRAVQNVCEGYGLIYDGCCSGGGSQIPSHPHTHPPTHPHPHPSDPKSIRGGGGSATVREVLCGGGQLGGCGGGHVWKEREAREKVVGVAWEGIGRSRLGLEVGVC